METNAPRSTSEPMTQTAGLDNLKPVSVETLTNAMQEIGMLPKLDQWIVVDPRGRMYRGTVEQLLPILAREHPLMQMPNSIDFGRGG